MDNGVPILSSSYGSGGIGAQEVYMRWNGETWEEFAFYHVKMDYEAMQDSDEMIYSIRDIMYGGEELEEEEFFSRIEALNLKPISRGLEELFGVTWSGMEMSAFVVGYQDHLSQLAPGETLCALGDVDGDGVEEVLWYVEDPFLPWRQNLAYQSRSYSLQPEQTEVYFSSENEGSLVLGNTEEDGIVITTMPAPVSGICGMRIENGEIVFDLNGNVQTKFAYVGIDAETGMSSLEERVSIYEAYLRTGEWYSFSPQDTFADIYHFSGDNKGYTTQRKTETGEDVDYGYNFQYAISSDGQGSLSQLIIKNPVNIHCTWTRSMEWFWQAISDMIYCLMGVRCLSSVLFGDTKSDLRQNNCCRISLKENLYIFMISVKKGGGRNLGLQIGQEGKDTAFCREAYTVNK